MRGYRLFSKVMVIVLLLSLLAGNGSLAQESRPQDGELPQGGGSLPVGLYRVYLPLVLR